MQDLAETGLKEAQRLGSEYADVRVVENERRTISVRDGKPDKMSHILGGIRCEGYS